MGYEQKSGSKGDSQVCHISEQTPGNRESARSM